MGQVKAERAMTGEELVQAAIARGGPGADKLLSMDKGQQAKAIADCERILRRNRPVSV